jgi:hypothetical protein
MLEDELRRHRAIADLAGYSLIARSGPRGSISVRRLVQAVTDDTLTTAGTAQPWIEAAAALLMAACSQPPATATTLAQWRRLQTHFRILVQHFEPAHPIGLALRFRIGRWTQLAGDTDGAARLYEPLVEDMRLTFGPRHRDTLATRCSLAECLTDVIRAKQLFTELVEDTNQALGAEDEQSLNVRGHLIRTMAQCGAVLDARQLLDCLLQDVRRVLGPNHAETLRIIGAIWRG